MDTSRMPQGESNPGPEPVIRDALTRAVEHAVAIPAGGAARDVLAQILSRALAAITSTHAVVDPVVRTTADSAQEALAVVAGIEQIRSSLAAMDAIWQVTAEQRIRAADAARNVPEKNQGHGTSSELAMARRVSPHASSLSLSSARRLVTHMPATLDHLATGRITEQTAQSISRTLDGAAQATCTEVDGWIAENHHRLDGLGTRRASQLVRELAQKADPSESRARAERAARARNVTMHPLADGMARISATLRALDAAAVMKVLTTSAESQRNAGSRVPHQALQADHLVSSILGAPLTRQEASDGTEQPTSAGQSPHDQCSGAQTSTSRIRLDVGIVITDRALLCGEDETEVARIEGYGPVPAHILLDTINGSPPGTIRPRQSSADDGPYPGGGSDDGPGARSGPGPDDCTPVTTAPPGEESWGDLDDLENSSPVPEHPDIDVSSVFRRLYTHPSTGELVAMESTARAFPVGLKRMIRWRDETCRTPWCNARIRHLDHIIPAAAGGPTSYDNGQGLCARCNYLKEHGTWNLTFSPPGSPPHISWRSPHGARGSSPTPHSESPPPPKPSDGPVLRVADAPGHQPGPVPAERYIVNSAGDQATGAEEPADGG
ncbi:HNH endonuclease [Brachybacterium epidermidis]|uniref:HNH endonuclease n=1 Tax=Brachybacterium epidermidis TaxID=2781983 RepID=UPI00398E7773